ncbi:hypothetical protein [Halorubrum laminariae]|uniref:Uncharacterized protein n=1 Tax=Halorubrum laminariae TaxID=1433523 RepID=A0ABD6C0D7_9EURY|nr:hypothetical protein [Halorubrum laminariae]
MVDVFTYNFGFDGSLDERADEVKSAIKDYFDGHEDATLVEFLGDVNSVPAEVMKVRVRIADGYDGYQILDDIKESPDALEGDVHIIQGGPE